MIIRTPSMHGFLTALGISTALGVLAAPVGAWSGTLSISSSESSPTPGEATAEDGISVSFETAPVAPNSAPFALGDRGASAPAASSPENAPEAVASADAGSAPAAAPQPRGLVQALSDLLQKAER
jgi:hypothetical protein